MCTAQLRLQMIGMRYYSNSSNWFNDSAYAPFLTQM